MEVKIRKATIEDLKVIQNLNLKLFEKEYEEYDKTLDTKWPFSKTGTDYFKKKITEENSFAIVAVVDNNIIGYIVGGITEPDSYRTIKQFAEIENMLVLEEYRSMKIGAKLVEESFKWFRDKGIKRVKLSAFAHNKGAINFYRKNGFEDYYLTLERDI
ncbi:MAG: GNAT family N-acetyltransferase [Candidatus Woesearchaeota archaeon]|nr:MAG: GNAT family N-acetyltransferase [Candidatus Woesearchaeota archaeon]